jgi:hypothetical protein
MKNELYSNSVSIDPDKILTVAERKRFENLHHQYETVFNPTIGKYNDASGRIRATINIRTQLPPKTKIYLPDVKKCRIYRQK